MFRLVVAAAITAAFLTYARSENLLDRASVLGSCVAMSAAAPLDHQWWECRAGELTGFPDLSKDGCNRGIMRGEVRYWLCPTALAVRAAGEPDSR